MKNIAVRKRRGQVLTFSVPMAHHLREGDCLLAGPAESCACTLRGLDGEEQLERWAVIWSRHRAEILAGWHRPFACLSAVLFDQAVLPSQPHPHWSDAERRALEIMHAEVERVREFRVGR